MKNEIINWYEHKICICIILFLFSYSMVDKTIGITVFKSEDNVIFFINKKRDSSIMIVKKYANIYKNIFIVIKSKLYGKLSFTVLTELE